jgi:hypothetical protein
LNAPHAWLGILSTLAISLAALCIRPHYLVDIVTGYVMGPGVFVVTVLA